MTTSMEARMARLEAQIGELTDLVRELAGARRATRYRTYQQIAAEGLATERQLRHWQQTDPAFRECLSRRGKREPETGAVARGRIYVDMEKFEAWFEAPFDASFDEDAPLAETVPITSSPGFLDPKDPRRARRRPADPSRHAGARG